MSISLLFVSVMAASSATLTVLFVINLPFLSLPPCLFSNLGVFRNWTVGAGFYMLKGYFTETRIAIIFYLFAIIYPAP